MLMPLSACTTALSWHRCICPKIHNCVRGLDLRKLLLTAARLFKEWAFIRQVTFSYQPPPPTTTQSHQLFQPFQSPQQLQSLPPNHLNDSNRFNHPITPTTFTTPITSSTPVTSTILITSINPITSTSKI